MARIKIEIDTEDGHFSMGSDKTQRIWDSDPQRLAGPVLGFLSSLDLGGSPATHPLAKAIEYGHGSAIFAHRHKAQAGVDLTNKLGQLVGLNCTVIVTAGGLWMYDGVSAAAASPALPPFLSL